MTGQANTSTEMKAAIDEACLRSPCAIARLLDVIGDKWTLLVIRDMMLGKQTYGELQKSPEGVPTNILADRLKRLEASGYILKKPYQQRPVRYSYHLTQKGLDLKPIILEVLGWAEKHLSNTSLLPAAKKQLQELPDRIDSLS